MNRPPIEDAVERITAEWPLSDLTNADVFLKSIVLDHHCQSKKLWLIMGALTFHRKHGGDEAQERVLAELKRPLADTGVRVVFRAASPPHPGGYWIELGQDAMIPEALDIVCFINRIAAVFGQPVVRCNYLRHEITHRHVRVRTVGGRQPWEWIPETQWLAEQAAARFEQKEKE